MSAKQKTLGSMFGAALGDTMGAVTELRPKKLIYEKFGGAVRDVLEPPNDTFARGSKPGRVTDDFSLIYCTTLAILENDGVIDDLAAKNALLKWAADESFYNQYAGPTTRAAVDRLKGKVVENYYDFICCDNAKASNGSAMKIAPAGFFHPGDIDRAIDAAITICRPTHNNNLSISGACAIAAAISEAMKEESNIFSIVQAGLYGARQGILRTEGTCSILAGPDVEKRIKLAIGLALAADDLDDATTQIADIVGSGLHISEAVPAVFGILVASKNDPFEAVVAAVNIGSDTDTIASMTGAIMGALHGVEAFPRRYLELIQEVNDYDLVALAEQVEHYSKICV